MRNIILILACFSILSSCHGTDSSNDNQSVAKTENHRKSTLDLAAIKKQLALQNRVTSSDITKDEAYLIEEKDIELCLEVIAEGLYDAGYIKPGKAEFERRIKEIYNCENTDHQQWKGIDASTPVTPGSWLAGPKFIKYYSDNYGEAEMDAYFMVAFGSHHFIFDLDFLDNLIKISPDDQYKIELPEHLIARNKYLFNGDQTSLDYLIRNDKDFLTSLVTIFGYDKVPAINDVVLMKYNAENKK